MSAGCDLAAVPFVRPIATERCLSASSPAPSGSGRGSPVEALPAQSPPWPPAPSSCSLPESALSDSCEAEGVASSGSFWDGAPA
jgi:hypothetical protein